VHAILAALTNCRMERFADAGAEEAVLLRVLQVLAALLRARAAPLLSDSSVCTAVNTCFQIVQHAAGSRGSELLQRTATTPRRSAAARAPASARGAWWTS